MITASTLNKRNYLASDEKKEALKAIIMKSSTELHYQLSAWVILENHYHILFHVNNGKSLGKYMNLVNGRSSYLINKIDRKPGRRIWYSFWDTCIRNENDYYTRFNYIHSNPVKHGYLKKPEDLKAYEFSSYSYYLHTLGMEWLQDIFVRYPIVDFMDKNDE